MMAVVSFEEINDGRGGGDEAKGSQRRVRVFRAITNSASDDAGVVLLSAPMQYARHPTETKLTLSQREAAPEGKSKLVWKVTCTYTWEQGDSQGEPANNPNPMVDAPSVEWSTQHFQEGTWKDGAGNAILNSAGQFFENLLMVDRSMTVASVTCNVDTLPAWFSNLVDTVNSSAFTIEGYLILTHQAKIQGIHIGRWQYRNNIRFRQVRVEVGIRTATWNRYILDEGTVALNGNPSNPNYGKPEPARLAGGQRATKPVPLDGAGAVLAAPTPATCHFITVMPYALTDFNSFRWP